MVLGTLTRIPIYSIAARSNEAVAAGSGASSFAPKRGYKLVNSSTSGEDGLSNDVVSAGSTDDYTQMEVGKAGTHQSDEL